MIEEQLYSLAVESAQVVADLLNWPDYDDTEIGETKPLWTRLTDSTPPIITVFFSRKLSRIL